MGPEELADGAQMATLKYLGNRCGMKSSRKRNKV
jgi:hypothetical protein